MKNKLRKRIWRKIIKSMNLYGRIPIDGYLTKREEKILNLSQFRKIQGWFTDTEGIALFRLSSSLDPGSVIVEIGTWKGRSAYMLASGASQGKKFYAIDPFNATSDKSSEKILKKYKDKNSIFNQFSENMKNAGVHDRIIPLKGLSREYVKNFSRIDLLFIDGDHSFEGCRFDFNAYSKYVPVGGYVAFHDYFHDKKRQGPTAVIEKVVMQASKWQFVGIYDSLWVGKRIRK